MADIHGMSAKDIAGLLRQLAWPLGVQDDLNIRLSNEAMDVFEEMGLDREKVSDALVEIANRFEASQNG